MKPTATSTIDHGYWVLRTELDFCLSTSLSAFSYQFVVPACKVDVVFHKAMHVHLSHLKLIKSQFLLPIDSGMNYRRIETFSDFKWKKIQSQAIKDNTMFLSQA